MSHLLLLLIKKIRLEITTAVEVYTAIGDGLDKKNVDQISGQAVLATSHPWNPMCPIMFFSVIHYEKHSK